MGANTLRRAISIALLLAPALALAVRAPPEPLPWGDDAGSRHAPYASGNCSACHEGRGPKPGKPGREIEVLCLSCHDDLKAEDHGGHAFRKCNQCHNAHDSRLPHLLRTDPTTCVDCHQR